MLRFSPQLPVWASLTRVQVNVFVPKPPSSQQLGVLPVAVSSDGFCKRFGPFVTTIAVPLVLVALPALSTARATIVCDPSATDCEFQSKLYGDVGSVPTVCPSTRKSTWSTAMLSPAVAASVTVPLTPAPAAGLVKLTVGAVVSNWIGCALTASAFPATSKARNLTVVAVETTNAVV